MNSTLSFRLSVLMLAAAVMFYSCQRNGGAKNTEVTETSETSADAPTPVPVDTAAAVTQEEDLSYIDTSIAIAPDAPKLTDYSWFLLENTDGTFGYEVLKSGDLVVSQPNIPGEGSTTGFKSKTQASAAAELVISKLEKDILPPTISEKELKKILKN